MKKLLLATLLITSPVMADVSDEKYLATLDAHMKQAEAQKKQMIKAMYKLCPLMKDVPRKMCKDQMKNTANLIFKVGDTHGMAREMKRDFLSKK